MLRYFTILWAAPFTLLHGQDSSLQVDFTFSPPAKTQPTPPSQPIIHSPELEFILLSPDQILLKISQARSAIWMDAIPTTHWKRTDILKVCRALYEPPTPCAHVVSNLCSDLRKSQVSDTKAEAYHLVLGYMLGRYPCRLSSDSITPCDRELVDDFLAIAREES